MNRAYKIIWSHVRNCYVVVSEIAKNHGKNNTKSIVSQLAARQQGVMAAGLGETGRLLFVAPVQAVCRWALPLVTAGLLLQPVTGWAAGITPASVLPDEMNEWQGSQCIYPARYR